MKMASSVILWRTEKSVADQKENCWSATLFIHPCQPFGEEKREASPVGDASFIMPDEREYLYEIIVLVPYPAATFMSATKSSSSNTATAATAAKFTTAAATAWHLL